MGAWQQIAPLPNGLYMAAGVFHPTLDKVFVFGGRKHIGVSGWENRTTYIYDPAGNTWSTGAQLPWVPTTREKAFVAPDGKIHVLNFDNLHASYDPATDTWETRAWFGVPGTTNDGLAFQDAAGRIIVSYTPGGGPQIVRRYTPSANTWEALPNVPAPYDRTSHYPGVLGDDGKFYVPFGDRMLRYNPAGPTWDYTAAIPDTSWGGVGLWPISRLPNGLILRLPALVGGVQTKRIDGYNPADGTWTMGVIPDFIGPVHQTPIVVTDPENRIWVIGGYSSGQGSQGATDAFMYLQNRPPTAPTLRTLTGGVLVNTAIKNRARHDFNDPDEGDSQAKFNWRHRIVGSASWVAGTVESPNPWYDIAAGELDPGNYERQVQTFDSSLEPSPWTPSGFFTAADPPAGPTPLYPVNGQLLEQVEFTEWSVGAQYAYQVRRVADDGDGNPVADPVGADVYFDTGEVVDALARRIPLTFETNDRTEHVQIRIKATAGGLFSDWVTVTGEVSYTPPPEPDVTIYVDGSTLLLMIVNPAPVDDQPPAVYNDVLIDDGKRAGRERKKTLHPTNTPYRYRTPVSRRDYAPHIEVVAVAANGTTSSTGS